MHRTRPVGERTSILRQPLTTHYEAPFVFLLLGNTGALLIDTGATADSVIATSSWTNP